MAGPAESDSGGGEAETGYMYMFEADRRQFLFIRNIGTGAECVAQLVRDLGTGTNLVRKVGCRRLQRLDSSNPGDKELPPFRKPNEIRILRKINKIFKAPEAGIPRYIVDYYGHEYIKSKHVNAEGRSTYHSVSYWKLCDGQSIKTWWQGPPINYPWVPTSIVARMVRQILSTFHWLYTAGHQPVYHGDVHAGNIWLHWPENTMLPDFYLGDFGHARFADDENSLFVWYQGVPPPVSDLLQLYDNLYSLLLTHGNLQGHGDPGRQALRQLCNAINKVVYLWESTDGETTPPDLRPLIKFAQNLEDRFGKGGDDDETTLEKYMTFITKERGMALRTEKDDALVVKAANIEEALNPTVINMAGVEVQQEIHGPWILVTVDGYLAEGERVTHHRPNTGDLNAHKEGLSYTAGQPTADKPCLGSRSDDPSPRITFSFSQDIKAYLNKALKTAVIELHSTIAPGALEKKAKHWHALLHGARCECDDEVWMVDMENELKQARMSRAVGDMQVAAFDFLEVM